MTTPTIETLQAVCVRILADVMHWALALVVAALWLLVHVADLLTKVTTILFTALALIPTVKAWLRDAIEALTAAQVWLVAHQPTVGR